MYEALGDYEVLEDGRSIGRIYGDVDRYSFIARDLHPLLLAGLKQAEKQRADDRRRTGTDAGYPTPGTRR
jgi:hypothetical protein